VNGYVARLLARADRTTPTVRPRLASPFHGPTAAMDVMQEASEGRASLAPLTDGRERQPAPTAPTDADTRALHRGSGDPLGTVPRAAAPRVPRLIVERTTDAAPSVAVPRGESQPAAPPAALPVPVRAEAPVRREETPHARPDERRRGDEGFRLMPDRLPRDDAGDRAATSVGGTVLASAVAEARREVQRQSRERRGDDARATEIHVSIGRIEVTATPAGPTPARRVAERAPKPSLADYLARRAAGGGGS
jgi:hypothetical protein